MKPQTYQEIAGCMTSGEIVDLEEAYVRNVSVPWYVWLPILVFAGIGQIPLFLIAMARGANFASAGARRSFKEFRAGPGVVVTPVWIRNGDGTVTEVEVHGYLASERLMLGDRVWTDLRPQSRADLPRRAVRIHNLTTGQPVNPHPDTLLTHLGLPVLLQAAIGLVLVAFMIAASQL